MREITLDSAAFLDSTQAAALVTAGTTKAELQRVATMFLHGAYEGVGKAPQHLDADDVHTILGHLMPGQFQRTEELADRVLPILRAYLTFLEGRAVVPQAFEVRQSLEATAPIFLAAVRSGEAHVHHHGPPPKPFVHKAAKTGRNDPCPCGSGKKFKQCCLRLGQ